MAEYIEREAFLDDIEERYCLPCKWAGKDYDDCICRSCWVDDMCGEVIDAPVADVVRCHECSKHSDADGKHYCKFWRMYCPDDSDFFCKAGKRKDGDGNA